MVSDNLADDIDCEGPERRQCVDSVQPSERNRRRRGVPRWFAGLCCSIVIVWACIKLYEYQHAAAPAARRLWSSRASERLGAVGELERFGRADPEVAIPALVNAVDDADSRVRAHAAMALVTVVSGASGTAAPSVPDVKAALEAIGNLLDDPQPDVRATATQALWMTILVNHVPEGQIDLERATNAVTSRLDDFDPAVRLCAIQGIGIVGPKVLGEPPAKLVAAMDEGSDKHRDAAIEALAGFHDGLPRLIPSLVKSAEAADPRTRAGYLKLLSRIRPPKFSGHAVPHLISALSSLNGAIVAVAASDLAAMEGTAPSLKNGPDRSAARTAVRPLIAALSRWLDSNNSDAGAPDSVIAISEALGLLAPNTPLSDEAVAALAKVLRAGDTTRRVAAAKALRRFHPGQALFTIMTDMVVERDRAVRVAVLWAIHDIDFAAPFIVPRALDAALKDESADVRAGAAVALGHSGIAVDPYVPGLLYHAEHDANLRVRELCLATLQHLAASRKLTAAALPTLIKALTSPNSDLRLVATEMLASLVAAAAPAVPALVTLAKIGPQVTVAAAIGVLRELAAHGNPNRRADAGILLDALKHPD